MKLLRGALLCWFACALAAQNQGQAGDPDEVGRQQRALQRSRAEVERLLDLRMRHDLGLPTDDGDAVFRQDTAVTPEGMEQMRRQLREEVAATDSIRSEFDKLRSAVEQLRAATQARLAREQADRTMVEVPLPGSGRVLPHEQSLPVVPPRRGGVDSTEVPQPAPAGETARPPVAMAPRELLELDPMRAQIHGSGDHLRVAQALFKAGQALMDSAEQARFQGKAAIGKDLDERARERLDRALAELQPLLAEKEPPYPALFYQGRCLELLFRYSERHEGLSLAASPTAFQQREQAVRDPFLRISARDVGKTGERGELDVLGPWGQAAQTAMEHFRWMNVHAGYDARQTIEALTWPGEKDEKQR